MMVYHSQLVSPYCILVCDSQEKETGKKNFRKQSSKWAPLTKGEIMHTVEQQNSNKLAGKIFGNVDTAIHVIKQLAFENANKYC
ncbi:hypothetical protein STEG23_014960 [Scotinomys teguina]